MSKLIIIAGTRAMNKAKLAYFLGMVLPPFAYAIMFSNGVIKPADALPYAVFFILFMAVSWMGFKGWLIDPWA